MNAYRLAIDYSCLLIEQYNKILWTSNRFKMFRNTYNSSNSLHSHKENTEDQGTHKKPFALYLTPLTTGSLGGGKKDKIKTHKYSLFQCLMLQVNVMKHTGKTHSMINPSLCPPISLPIQPSLKLCHYSHRSKTQGYTKL